MAEADVEEGVRVRPKVLAAHPRMVIHSTLQDCHLYIMKRWVIDYVIADKNISTIKGELVPLLVGKQFSSGKAVGGERQEGGALLPLPQGQHRAQLLGRQGPGGGGAVQRRRAVHRPPLRGGGEGAGAGGEAEG